MGVFFLLSVEHDMLLDVDHSGVWLYTDRNKWCVVISGVARNI